jgi:hypothetical protein
MSTLIDNSNRKVYGDEVRAHMFEALRVVEKATGFSASENAKLVFKHAGIKNDEATVTSAGFIQNLAMCEDTLEILDNRPKEGRPIGRCLDNAVAEFRETGNRLACGYLVRDGGVHVMMVFHFFNIDKDGVPYETEQRHHSGGSLMVRVKATHNDCGKFYNETVDGGAMGGDKPAYIAGHRVMDYQAFFNPETHWTHFTYIPFGWRRNGKSGMGYAGLYDGKDFRTAWT